MPSQIISFYALQINLPITDGTLIFLLIQPPTQSKKDTATHEQPHGSSSLLSSPLQHQANCLQAIHKTIQQFNQHLKAEHLDRQTLQLIVLQLQNVFGILRYLLSSPRLKKSSISIHPLKTKLPVLSSALTQNLTPTLLHLPSPFPILVNHNFVVLPRWAQSENKQLSKR